MADSKDPQILVPTIITQSPAPSLSGVVAAAYYINAGYQTPSGNQPATNNNMVFVWEGGPDTPLGLAPVGSGTVSQNRTQGNVAAAPTSNPFFGTDYVMAYSVGPAATSTSGVTTYPNVAATVYIPGGVGSGLPMQFYGSSLAFVPNGIDSTSVNFSYQFPGGTNPSANGAWVAIWTSALSTPYGVAPQWYGKVMAPTSKGNVLVSNVQLSGGGAQYTCALFASGVPTSATSPIPTTVVSWMTFSLDVKP